MSLSTFIAKRYFFSKRKKKFINFLSLISMSAVMVGSMTLIMVLSVFNGLENLIKQVHSSFTADLKISYIKGKSFSPDTTTLRAIQEIEGVNAVIQVVEDHVVVHYQDQQITAQLKGVSDAFHQVYPIQDFLVYGDYENSNKALIGSGIRYALSYNFGAEPLEMWYPKRKKKISFSEKDLNRKYIQASGMFSIEKKYDDQYIIVPISFARHLMDYEGAVSSLEVEVKEGYLAKVKKALYGMFGKDYLIQDQNEQQSGLYKALRLEKLFAALTLSFILAIASLNIFFALSMLVIEKKKDIGILYAMGASRSKIGMIFLKEGFFIAGIGAVTGLILGTVLIMLQQEYGFLKMGTVSAIVESYPVQLKGTDLLLTFLLVFLITILMSLIPGLKARKLNHQYK